MKKKVLSASGILCILLCLTWVCACNGNKKTEDKQGDLVDSLHLKKKEIRFAPVPNVLQLQSYYLSASCRTDSSVYVLGYNYKVHALDCIDLTNRKLTQISLRQEGPDGVQHPTGMFIRRMDSIWVSDRSGSAVLLNHSGEVLHRVDLRQCLGERQDIAINTNYAMSTSRLYYHAQHHSLLFSVATYSPPVKDFTVKELFLSDGRVADHHLSPSIVNPDRTKKYAYMDEPNVNFKGDSILFNYPYDSHIYVLDTRTKKTTCFDADSRYVSHEVPPCDASDYPSMERYGVENPHFYDVMYIPRWDAYARLHSAGREYESGKDIGFLLNDKALYLTVLDKELRVVDERKLPSHRYSIFTGWCGLYDGIALFVDNPLDSVARSDDELYVDKYY